MCWLAVGVQMVGGKNHVPGCDLVRSLGIFAFATPSLYKQVYINTLLHFFPFYCVTCTRCRVA